MPEAIAQLCEIIAEKLRDAPEATQAELMAQVETAIAANPQLEAALKADPQMLQTNQDGARGFQALVKGGIANIGDHYHLTDPEKFKAALEGVLQQLQKIYQPVGIPKNLPDRTQQFVGRETVMEKLHTQLQQAERLYLQGMGGIGKTELARQYAWSHYEQGTYSAGICWLQAREQDLGSQIVKFAKVHLGLNIRDDLELSGQVADCWQRWTPGNVLVIFDDVTDYGAIASYLPPQEARFKVLLTTRSYLGQSMKQFEVPVLSAEASLDLLRALIGKERITQELNNSQALILWLGYLPLGLELVGRYLASKQNLSLTNMQQRLTEQRLAARALVKREAGMTAMHESVAAAFELSWQELDEKTHQLSYLLSLFALAPIPWSVVELCFRDWGKEELEDIRDLGLINRSLVQRAGKDSYQLHQLLREFFIVKRESELAEKAVQVRTLKQQFCRVIAAIAHYISDDPDRVLDSTAPLEIPHLEEAAVTLKEFFEDDRWVALCVGLGRFQTGQRDYVHALPWLQQGLAVAQTLLSEQLMVPFCLNNLGYFFYSQGRYCEAEPFLAQALELWQRQVGEEHLDVAGSLTNLAELYHAQGRYAEAEPLFLRALELFKQVLDEESLDVAASLKNLARLYHSQGRYAEAEPLFLRALELYKQALGEESLDVADSLTRLARLYHAQGRYRKARSLYVQALELQQQLFGDTSSHIASNYEDIADLCKSETLYGEAERLYMQAFELRKQLLGEEHSAIAISLSNLAALYQLQGHYSRAEPLYIQALGLRQRLLGEMNSEVVQSLNNLAGLYYLQGRNSEAEPLFVNSLQLGERLWGQESPCITQSLNNLATIYSSQGRSIEAEHLYIQALKLKKRAWGEIHPSVALAINNLASLYHSQKRYREAVPLFQQALGISILTSGGDHPNTSTIRENLLNFILTTVHEGQIAVLDDEPWVQDIMHILNLDRSTDDLSG